MHGKEDSSERVDEEWGTVNVEPMPSTAGSCIKAV
jgi:hypothetical protein